MITDWSTVWYNAVAAVKDGDVAEVELSHCVTHPKRGTETFVVTVRREQTVVMLEGDD